MDNSDKKPPIIWERRIPLEDWQIAAYYGFEEDTEDDGDGSGSSDDSKSEQTTRDASEVPTFRAQFKEDLFKSTLMDDSSCSQATTQSDLQEMPTFRAQFQKDLFKSTLLDGSCSSSTQTEIRRSTEMPTFRADFQKDLFKSTLLDGSCSSSTQTDIRRSTEMPTFRAAFRKDLFKSTLLDDSSCSRAQSEQPNELPTFRARFKEDLFKSTLLDGSSCSQASLLRGTGFEIPHRIVMIDEDEKEEEQANQRQYPQRIPDPSFLDGEDEECLPLPPLAAEHVQQMPKSNKNKKGVINFISEAVHSKSKAEAVPHRIVMIDEDEEEEEQPANERKYPQRIPSMSFYNETANFDDDEDEDMEVGKENRESSSSSRMDSNLEKSIVDAFADLFNSPAPKHFRHVVCKKESPELAYQPKLIRPDPQSPSVVQLGLRRSSRSRLPRLQSHMGQKAIYEVDAEGNRVLVGASELLVKDSLMKKFRVLDTVVAAEKDRDVKSRKRQTKMLMRKRRHERSQYKGRRNLSKVQEEEEEEEDGDDGEEGVEEEEEEEVSSDDE